MWLLVLLMVGLGVGIGEEIMFCGVLFWIVEEGLGMWVVLVVLVLFFGVVYIFNLGVMLWSLVVIVIEVGLLFGMFYYVICLLLLCMGVYVVWNFV